MTDYKLLNSKWILNQPMDNIQNMADLYYGNDYFKDELNKYNFAIVIVILTSLILACFNKTRMLAIIIFCVGLIIIILLYNQTNQNTIIEFID